MLVGLPVPAAAFDWKPIDHAHLALKEPKVQPDADAEALIWDIRVADDFNFRGDFTTTFEHYIRLKIFTDRARERYATVDIPYVSGADVKDVAARTIRPDGSIVELKSSDVYRRTLVKADELKVKVVSFAVPAIEKGVIVEYRWREVYRDSIAMNLRLRFSREIPVHRTRYFVRPLALPGVAMQAWPFNGDFDPPQKQKDGFTMMSLSNVPADVDEEYGPPPFELRPWVFISYAEAHRARPSAAAEFAKSFGKSLHEEYGKRAKPNDEIKRLAQAAVAAAGSDAERLNTLTRQQLRRVDGATATAEDRKIARENRNAADALKRGVETSDDAVVLLMALATAAGLDARAAATPDRADLFQRSVQSHPYFVQGRIVAVRSGDGWLFADPANEFASAGQLRWQYEDQQAIIGDPARSVKARTPLAPPEYSMKKRTGTFRLLEDGTLEGDVRLEFTGHWADTFSRQEAGDAPSEIEKDLRETVEKRLPGAEVSDVRLEHASSADGTYLNAFRLRVPGYAQRTGARLFLQPGVFQKGIGAMFQSTERKSEVYFPFAWAEHDSIRIELPAGYSLEQPDRPAAFDVGSVTYEARVAMENGRQLLFERRAVVGKGAAILFPQSSYRPLHAAFDAMHRADGHTLVLRKDAAQ